VNRKSSPLASSFCPENLADDPGRGSLNMEMHHYDVVPAQLQEKIIEKAKAARGEVVEEEE